VILLPILLLQMGMANPGHLYLPSAEQLRIDRGFSMVLIDTLYLDARGFMKLDRSGACQASISCETMDKNGVRYTFGGETMNRRYVIAKTVRAADYLWKSIPALGIGQYRDKPMVMAAIGRETRGAPFDCRPDTGGELCTLPLKPGRIEISFDTDGKLVQASLVGYDDYP
jgi:hypothetical protein